MKALRRPRSPDKSGRWGYWQMAGRYTIGILGRTGIHTKISWILSILSGTWGRAPITIRSSRSNILSSLHGLSHGNRRTDRTKGYNAPEKTTRFALSKRTSTKSKMGIGKTA